MRKPEAAERQEKSAKRREARRATFVPQRSAQSIDDPFTETPAERRDQSLRVLDIFQYFRETRRAARAIEVSRALGLPNSSVDRTLKALVRRGYLCFDADSKGYAPTYRIVGTATDIELAFQGGPAVRRIIEALHAETGQTVCLCVQNDCWVQNVAAVAGALYTPSIHGEGMRAAILGSAPGNALMATKTDRQVRDIAQRARDRGYLELDAHGLNPLMEAVIRARRDGYAAWRGFSRPGAVAIAVTVKPAPDVPNVAIVLVADNAARSAAREKELGLLIRKIAQRHLR